MVYATGLNPEFVVPLCPIRASTAVEKRLTP